MYKDQSRRMQHGSLLRLSQPSPRPDARLMNESSSTTITNDELEHFSFEYDTAESLLVDLVPVIETLASEGIRKPQDISRRLNADGWNTACGEPWTPRLVAFLLQFMFEPARIAQRKAKIEQSSSQREPDKAELHDSEIHNLGTVDGNLTSWRSPKGKETAGGGSNRNSEDCPGSKQQPRSAQNSGSGPAALWTLGGAPMSPRAIAQKAAAGRGMIADDWISEAIIAHARVDLVDEPSNDEKSSEPAPVGPEIAAILTELQARVAKLEAESQISPIARLFGRKR